MADTSLDDFFAKKDKSKKKTKGKLSIDVPTPQISLNRKIKKKKDQEKQPTTTMTGQPPKKTHAEEDQEWNDYEQETEKDYSGLRIQNLQIKSENDEEMDNDSNFENNENSETGERRENNTGPWNKSGRSNTPPPPPPAPAPVLKEEEPSPSEDSPKNFGRYVPPAQRGLNPSMTITEARMARIRNSKKEAPNIHCELDFPTLGGAVTDIESKDFERVRSGNRNFEAPSNHSLQLKLNNKYRALQD